MRWPWSRDEPARAAEPPRTVCMFLDDSPGAERAFRWAQRNLVDPKRDRLHLVSIATPPAFTGDGMPGDLDLDVTAAAAHRALSDDLAGAGKALADAAAARYGATLARFADEARERGAKAVSTAVLRGDVAGLAGPMAVDYAAMNGCDVAVVGSRGLGAFKRGVLSAVGLGSVSDTLVHNLHCPTVVVKPPAPEVVCAATAVHSPPADDDK